MAGQEFIDVDLKSLRFRLYISSLYHHLANTQFTMQPDLVIDTGKEESAASSDQNHSATVANHVPSYEPGVYRSLVNLTKSSWINLLLVFVPVGSGSSGSQASGKEKSLCGGADCPR